jgi:hypothetical protein
MLTLPHVDVDADADPVKMLVISTRYNKLLELDKMSWTNALRIPQEEARCEYKIGLGCSCRARSWSNENKVVQMASLLGVSTRPADGTRANGQQTKSES